MSYLTPDRTKAITARKLGDDFDKTAVFAAFVRNAKQVRAKKSLVHSAPTMQDFIKQQNAVSRVVDMEAAKAKGKGYEHWAKTPDKSSGHRVQDVTISYNYIGILPANLLYDVMNGKAA